MNRLADRRKLHLPLSKEQEGLRESNPPISLSQSKHLGGGVQKDLSNSLQEMRRINRDLENLLHEEKAKRIEAEDNFREFQKRAIAREKQFYHILEHTNKDMRVFRKGPLGKDEEIKQIYKELFENFELSNSATNTLVEQKYKQNLLTMERRISSIMETFNQEMDKNKKISTENFQRIKNEV